MCCLKMFHVKSFLLLFLHFPISHLSGVDGQTALNGIDRQASDLPEMAAGTTRRRRR